MNPTQLPPRLKERCFRVFEVDIARIVREFPNAVELSPSSLGYTALTYSSRIRDAMASLHRFKWSSSIVNTYRFNEIYNEIKVSHRPNGEIYAGGAKELKSLDSSQPTNLVDMAGYFQQPTAPVEAVEQTIHLTDTKEKQLMCLLASLRLFNQPVAVSGIEPQEVEMLEENFDVQISEKGGKTFIL